MNAVELLPKAVDAGVAFVPGAAFYADHADPRTLRLSFVTASVEQIHTGIAALAQAIRAFAKQLRGERCPCRPDRFSKWMCSPPRLTGATRWRVVMDGTGLSHRGHAAFHPLDQPVGVHLSAAAHRSGAGRRARTTGCAFSARGASCRLPATRRWAVATPGCDAGGQPKGETRDPGVWRRVWCACNPRGTGWLLPHLR